jgi:predicted Fe-Mo cluster-binding NifX family protein
MKIAIAADGTYVSGHFGHCIGFVVYDYENGKVISRTFLENPGHQPGLLPKYLKEEGVNVVIAGGMGARAQQILQASGIQVIVGARGTCDDVFNMFIEGKLESTGSICNEHQHKGDCHN